MSLASIMKDTCKKLGVSMAELARRSNQSPQNLGKKIKNETLGYEEFLEMLGCLGVQYEYRLVFPDEIADDMTSPRTRARIDILEQQIEMQKRTIDYLQGINRDIRSGINVINGTVELTRKHKDDRSRVNSCLETINTVSSQITSLLNDGSGLNILTSSSGVTEIVTGKRCLLVEDSELNREVTKASLEDSGIVVDVAENGQIAVKLVEENQNYDFILMDIVMPVMDGYEASRKIREKHPDLPIIALSANVSEEDIKKAEDAGMNDYVSKPVSVSQLLAAAARNLRRSI